MEERNPLQRITRHLQKADVQQRIMQDMQRAREEATVTISNAAGLFSFTENQLRDWEKNGLLSPQRRLQDTEQEGKGAKRRQYTSAELDKLAIIRELMNASFSPGIIPTDVDEIWAEVVARSKSEPEERLVAGSGKDTEHRPIDQRVEQIEKAAFWRYFVSQALKLSLMLICEGVPETVAGIILPLEQTGVADIVRQSTDLPRTGYSLVGWLNQNRSFYTFLEKEPSFEHPSDFRIEPLVNLAKSVSNATNPAQEQLLQDNVLIIVQRKTKPLLVNKEAIRAIQRILGLLYATIEQWQPGFENGIRHWMYQVTDFASSSNTSDEVLKGLTNMIVQLGGKTADGQDLWRFCNILTPQDISLPLQQRTLLVRAQSEHAPYNFPAISARIPGLSFRAFLSGQIIYRSDLASKDFMIIRYDSEESTRSAIAIPLAGEEGMAIGVLYIASDKPCAFSEDDRRVLRIIGRMIEELLLTYRARLLPVGFLTDMIATPKVVDASFKEFLSEGDFVNDVEALLADIFASNEDELTSEEEVSFIAVDIDNQSNLAIKYGDRVAKILSRAVGLRVQGQMRLSSKLEHRRVYHVSADRFYLILKGMPLHEARNKAAQLKATLEGEYLLDARRVTTGRPPIPESMLRLSDVTVRLGVTSYKPTKLKEVLGRYIPEFAVVQVTGLLSQSLDQVLVQGQQEGGSCIISWEPEIWSYKLWQPS